MKSKLNICSNCKNNTFITTKTVYHDHKITIIDNEIFVKELGVSGHQPSTPYGYFVCEKCNNTFHYKDILK